MPCDSGRVRRRKESAAFSGSTIYDRTGDVGDDPDLFVIDRGGLAVLESFGAPGSRSGARLSTPVLRNWIARSRVQRALVAMLPCKRMFGESEVVLASQAPQPGCR